jgi:PilZ domain
MEIEEVQANPHYGIVNFERRKYPRLDVNLPLEYVRSDMSVNLGRVVNASEGGLLVWIPEKMELGQILRITLFLPSGPKLVASIRAEVEIAWKDIDWGGELGDRRFGIKFVHISYEDLERLKGFLRNHDYGRADL